MEAKTHTKAIKNTAKKVVSKKKTAQAAGSARALTEREVQILQQMANGRSTRHLVELLGLTENTIETHRRKILKKLNAANMIEAVTIAFRKKILK